MCVEWNCFAFNSIRLAFAYLIMCFAIIMRCLQRRQRWTRICAVEIDLSSARGRKISGAIKSDPSRVEFSTKQSLSTLTFCCCKCENLKKFKIYNLIRDEQFHYRFEIKTQKKWIEWSANARKSRERNLSGAHQQHNRHLSTSTPEPVHKNRLMDLWRVWRIACTNIIKRPQRTFRRKS